MKKISLVMAVVLIGTMSFARSIDEPATEKSSMKVTNVSGSTLYKLYYKSVEQGKVKVSIRNEKNEIIFNETFTDMDCFIRSYNFKDLPQGEYTFKVEDENGTIVENVNYSKSKAQKLIHIQKLSGEESKYVLSMSSQRPENVTVSIFDRDENLIYKETETVGKEFAKIYNLKDYNSFTIEVHDNDGSLLKRMTY